MENNSMSTYISIESNGTILHLAFSFSPIYA